MSGMSLPTKRNRRFKGPEAEKRSISLFKDQQEAVFLALSKQERWVNILHHGHFIAC